MDIIRISHPLHADEDVLSSGMGEMYGEGVERHVRSGAALQRCNHNGGGPEVALDQLFTLCYYMGIDTLLFLDLGDVE